MATAPAARRAKGSAAASTRIAIQEVVPVRPLLLICMAALVFAVVTTASASNQFAAGSAKTDTALAVAGSGEHAAFSVHSVSGPLPCPASGQMIYKADASGFA